MVLYRCGLVGGRVCILGDKSKIDARKEDRGSRKRKEGQFYRDGMRGRLRDTIDGGAENTTGVTTRWNQERLQDYRGRQQRRRRSK
jgi:hypothetical protein